MVGLKWEEALYNEDGNTHIHVYDECLEVVFNFLPHTRSPI